MITKPVTESLCICTYVSSPVVLLIHTDFRLALILQGLLLALEKSTKFSYAGVMYHCRNSCSMLKPMYILPCSDLWHELVTAVFTMPLVYKYH